MKNINLLDCTLRDGGYYNNWKFTNHQVNEYLKKIYLSKIDVVEIGFRFLEKNENLGPFAFSKEKMLKKILTSKNTKLSVMVNSSDFFKTKKNFKTLIDEYFPKKKYSKLSIVRVATHYEDIFRIFNHIKYLKKLGYKVFVNLMQINRINEKQLISAITELKKSKSVDVFYFADSFGNMKPDNVQKICRIIRKNWPYNFGIHTHDNCGYGLENSLSAIKHGAKWVDATVQGMGRGAGNVTTESILCELSRAGFKKFNPDPVYSLSQSFFLDLKKKYNWGKSIYYHLAAINNIHQTYIQELLVDDRYTHDQILNIINSLKKINSTSFNSDKLKEIVNNKINLKNTWNAQDWCLNKNVLLLGQGQTIQTYNKNIKKFIKQMKCKVLSLNINKNFASKFIDYYIASNEARIMIDHQEYNKLSKKIIIPLDRMRSILSKIKVKNIKNYGLVIKKDKFRTFNKYCELPNSLVAGYAMALCSVGKAKNIYLAGFDGYKDNETLDREMNNYFLSIKRNFKKLNFYSLTPTNYSISKKLLKKN